MQDCYDGDVTPFPIFSKIRRNALKLIGYNLNEGYSDALEKFLNKQNTGEAFIERIVLHENSASDKSLAAMLRGLQ